MAKVKLEKEKVTITWEQEDKDRFLEIKNANGPGEGETEKDAKARQIKAVKMEMTARAIHALSDVREVVEGLHDKQIADLQAEKTRRESLDETDNASL